MVRMDCYRKVKVGVDYQPDAPVETGVIQTLTASSQHVFEETDTFCTCGNFSVPSPAPHRDTEIPSRDGCKATTSRIRLYCWRCGDG